MVCCLVGNTSQSHHSILPVPSLVLESLVYHAEFVYFCGMDAYYFVFCDDITNFSAAADLTQFI